MDIIFSILSSLSGQAANYAITPIKNQFSYVFDHKNKMRNLKEEVEKLTDARDRVQHSVDAAKRNGEEIELDVQKWLINANNKISDDAEKFKEAEDKAQKRCFIGLCPNLKSRYELSKKAEEVREPVAKLLKEYQAADSFEKVSYHVVPQGTGTTLVKGYDEFPSRIVVMEEIMEALKDPNARTIGIYGMGGVGKTMLVKEVARKTKEENIFDEVVMAAVSMKPNNRKIQGEIADSLGLKFEEETDYGRAMRLRQRLNKEQRILIILDDIWTRLDLEAVGISFEDDHSVSSGGNTRSLMQNINPGGFQKTSAFKSKLLLTSRSQEVLCNYMDAKEKLFEVRVLSHEEAMALFSKIVGQIIQEPGYQSLAHELVGKCAGLPVAISAIANALKDTSVDIWEDAMQQLRRSNPSNIEGMEESVYSTIELSYEFLRSKEAKSQFLLCGLHPQGLDIQVSDLLRYNFGLDLLEGAGTLEKARKRVNALIHKLKTSSLLFGDDNDGVVKMHDIVRDVSISVASKNEKMFVVEDDVHMEELLRSGKLNSSTALSLPYSNIHQLPDVLKCPELNFFLFFCGKDSFLNFPDSLFKEMNKLKVLSLTGMDFPSLPSSICSLASLQTLCLHGCTLGDIAMVKGLKQLEILSLRGSKIKQLPRDIVHLTRLKLLDLKYCDKLKVIPANILSSFSLLEELYVASFSKWELEGNLSITELKHLSNLTTIELFIDDPKMIQANLFSKKLERFKISIGHGGGYSSGLKYENSRRLSLRMKESLHLDHIKILLEKAEDLRLSDLAGVKNFVYELNGMGFPQLKNLHLENSSEIQYIINSVEWAPCKAFPYLETMFLYKLFDLEKIFYGQVPAESLKRLRIIKVNRCDKLKSLFSFSMVKQLSQLQELSVASCESITEIVAEDKEEEIDENEATNQTEFCQLRALDLMCGSFISFCFEEKSQVQLSGGTISSSMPFFNNKITFPCLENLRLTHINNEWIWCNQLSCINLTSLKIGLCNNLKHLFSASMVRTLQQLIRLEVSFCDSLKEIIPIAGLEGKEEEEEEMIDKIVFPQLNFLKFLSCPVLIGFCSGKYRIEFSSLKELEVLSCDKMEGFVFKSRSAGSISSKEDEEADSRDNCLSSIAGLFNEKVAFPNLEKMTISNLNGLKMIFDNHLPADSFQKLKAIEVTYCHKLLAIFPSNILGGFYRLEKVLVSHCNSLEHVFEVQELCVERRNAIATQLRELHISGLPNLRQVWSKDPGRFVTFRNLHSVNAIECWSLKSLFPASVAKGLLELEQFMIASCGLESIVSEEGVNEISVQFVFPRVWSLTLWNLPNLRCFYPEKHTIVWRSLRNLITYHCSELKVLGVEPLSIQEGHGTGQYDLSSQRPLFFVDKVIHKLEELSLNSEESKMIDRRFEHKLFPNIKALHVICFHDELDVFPIGLLKKFCNLEKLVVLCCEFEDLWPREGDAGEGKHFDILTHLKVLRLQDLPFLRTFWSQTSGLNLALQKLEVLEVMFCDSLINLAPSGASLRNLKSLQVWDCQEIEFLFTSSSAKSLMQLRHLIVGACQNLREIIATDEEDEKEEEITLILEQVQFVSLPNLTTFYSGRYKNSSLTFNQQVESCPNLKDTPFSHLVVMG